MSNTKLTMSIDLGPVISPCCHSLNTRVVIENAQDPLGKEFFDIFLCDICKSSFTHPTPINLDKYYPSYYRGYGKLTAYLLSFFYRKQVQKWLKLSSKTHGKALEIGCGSGFMLKAISDLGWSASGIERTPEMATQAQENCKGSIIYETLDAVPYEDYYDLIILFNVLEHLDNPNHYIKKCNALLNISGRLIIVVPNFSSYQRLIFNKNWFHLDPPRHLFHFTNESLAMILEKNNMIIEKNSFISFEHDPIGWIESFINTLSSNKNLLTRYLSSNHHKINKVSRLMILYFSLIATPLAIILSIASWITKRGAIIQLVARKSNK